jgi:hypothetical protein
MAELTPEQLRELEFVDNVKSVSELEAGRTRSDSTRLKSLYIRRHGFDRWQQLCQSSSQSYGIVQ